MTKPPPEEFSSRIRRLETERLYSREGFRVPLRVVRVPVARTRLSLKEWLLYPLFIARV